MNIAKIGKIIKYKKHEKYSVVCIEYYTIFCLLAILSLNITTTSH